ncbi:MAG: molybdate ABC transporter substrate-binding protein [Pseudoxanthomonas sp.]
MSKAWSCLLALLLLSCNARAGENPPPLTVFAAASLKESMDEVAAAFRQQSGHEVRVSYAGSSALALQIQQGAPADVFVSADLDWMDYLQQRGLVDAGSRRNLLGNSLVLVAPAVGKATAIRLRPGTDLLPNLGDHGRIALALTASVPAGKYAKDSLISLGMWKSLQARVAETDNVRAALMLVARGETPLGIVYASDALAEPAVRVLATFPDSSHTPIVYPLARVAASHNPDAITFVRWLATPSAAKIFHAHGFKVL